MALTQDQIFKHLINDPMIKATIEDNQDKAKAQHEADLMLLGYNQCLLENGFLPEGWSAQDMKSVISHQKAKLGI